MKITSFADLQLSAPLLRAIASKGYAQPTPIQAQAIPHLLEGRDLLGVAQTGTGKTAAFALPMLQLLAKDSRRPRPRSPRALVLTPTRELASQVSDSFRIYGKDLSVTTTVVFGGVGQSPQVQALRRGVDVLVATPGRLLDLVGQHHVDLRSVEFFVLDEADRMLDMGFIRDVRRVIDELPEDRQSLLFSATMPADIVQLAQRLLHDPIRVEVTPPSTTVELIEQKVYFVEKADKRDLLAKLLEDRDIVRALVFTRTKHGADRVVKHLQKLDFKVDAIHGDKSQNGRERALAAFRDGKILALVATDIAARGIDVPEISHVINFDLPNVPESYVHRIGRTARAGRGGVALSFCDAEERAFLRDIEKEIRQRIPVVDEHAYRSRMPPGHVGTPPAKKKQTARPARGAPRGRVKSAAGAGTQSRSAGGGGSAFGGSGRSGGGGQKRRGGRTR